ncbi:MAG: histidine kinase [Actinomyces bowdenii]|nr:histidine kinase [Actinomyces bowdenii]
MPPPTGRLDDVDASPRSAHLALLQAAARALPLSSGTASQSAASPTEPARTGPEGHAAPEDATLAMMHLTTALHRDSPVRASLGGRLRTWYREHPFQVDSLIAVGVLLVNIPLGFLLLMRPSPALELPREIASALPLALGSSVIATALLAVRRRFPLASWLGLLLLLVAFQTIGQVLLSLSPEESATALGGLAAFVILGLPLCLGTIAVYRRPAAAWGAWAVTGLVFSINYLITESSNQTAESAWRNITTNLIMFAIPVLVGLTIRASRRNLEDLRMHTARMALAREQSALLAAAEERSRIAREMHDVVAHSLAVMITMADGAAAAIDRRPEQAKQALEVLAETGRSALADTRRLVGVLREDPPATSMAPEASPASAASPSGVRTTGAGEQDGGAHQADDPRTGIPRGGQPQASPVTSGPVPVVRELPVPEFAPPGTVAPVEPSAQIADLRRRATGTQADPTTGEAPMSPAPEQADIATLVEHFRAAGVPVAYTWTGASLPQDKALQLTLFRIAQESLTNVLRYAPTTKSVAVTVERHTGTAVLTVDNEAAPGSRPMHGSGKGLIGMRERAAVYGGTVQAGPTPTGWRVRAVLRWDEHDEGSSSWQMPL